MIKELKQTFCNHLFDPPDWRKELIPQEWPCCKCGKVFKGDYGLKILENGKCTGRWGFVQKN
jgi:hypothetical protein